MQTRHHRQRASRRRTRTRTTALIASVVIAIAALLIGSTATSAAPDQTQPKTRHYKATRAFVPDRQNGGARMPTDQEVDQVVATLAALGQRPAEELPQAQHGDTVTVDLADSNAGILLARPAADGTWETKCVFTLEEGAEFLGLVPVDVER